MLRQGFVETDVLEGTLQSMGLARIMHKPKPADQLDEARKQA